MQSERFNPYKVLLYSDRLRSAADGEIPLPVHWVVYPSSGCTLACPHCIMGRMRSDNPGMLSQSQMYKVADDAYRIGVKSVLFSGGGEPTLNPWLPETARVLRNRGIKVYMDTNGTRLTEEIVKSMDVIRVSLDATNAETYKRMHGKDEFDSVINGLALFSGSGTELGLSFLATKENIGEARHFCLFAQRFSPAYIYVRMAYYYTVTEMMASYSVFGELQALKKDMESSWDNVKVSAPEPSDFYGEKKFKSCYVNPLVAVLNPDGKFSICKDRFLRFGDYGKMTFEECWFSEEHRTVREILNVEDCPRCVFGKYNEIVESLILDDTHSSIL